MTATATDLSDLSPMWRERFAFFEQHGPLNTPEALAAFKALSYDEKLVLRMNWRALFLGIVYLPMLGLWRRWLMLMVAIAVGIGAAIVLRRVEVLDVSLPWVVWVVLLAFLSVCAASTNYAYYLKRTTGEDSYNPFIGESWQRPWF